MFARSVVGGCPGIRAVGRQIPATIIAQIFVPGKSGATGTSPALFLLGQPAIRSHLHQVFQVSQNVEVVDAAPREVRRFRDRGYAVVVVRRG